MDFEKVVQEIVVPSITEVGNLPDYKFNKLLTSPSITKIGNLICLLVREVTHSVK